MMLLYYRYLAVIRIGYLLILSINGHAVFARSLLENGNRSYACPATQPFQGSFCPGPYVDGNACVYGEVCCPERGGACTPETTCSCADDGSFAVSCTKHGPAGSVPCPSVCPKKSPAGNFTAYCDIDYRYLCVYGDAVSCEDTRYSYAHETECWCNSSSTFVCKSNVCPNPCPSIQPHEGVFCSAPFVNENSCLYGELCCPGEGKPCVPDKQCSCVGGFVHCEDATGSGSLQCPSLCPATMEYKECVMDKRYQCVYGDAVICDDDQYSHPYETTCFCKVHYWELEGYSGVMICETHACPLHPQSYEPCPSVQPSDGEACFAAFVNDNTCLYGEFCCPGGDCIPDIACSCQEDKIVCNVASNLTSLPCPSVCPTVPPMKNNSCNIDGRFKCVYGDAMICDDGSSNAYETECSCSYGTFTCRTNICPLPCPEIEPTAGTFCSGPFVHGNTCLYGQICCPVDGGKCIPDKLYSCLDSIISSVPYPALIPCQSLCPDGGLLNYAMCDIDSRYQCGYGSAVVCDDNITYFPHERECSCHGGTFDCNYFDCPQQIICPETQPVIETECSNYPSECNYGNFVTCDIDGFYFHETTCLCLYGGSSCCDESGCWCDTIYCFTPVCPHPCPETQPANGDFCSGPFVNYNSCLYGQFCCPGEDENCIPEMSCSCSYGSKVTCTTQSSLVCQSVCPNQPPGPKDACEIDQRYRCMYDNITLCDGTGFLWLGEIECSCYNGSFECSPRRGCNDILCPEIPPVIGEACSVSWIGFDCQYGKLCCPGEGGICVSEKMCFCDPIGLTIQCQSGPTMLCQSVCPQNSPTNGDTCTMDSQFHCQYTSPLIKEDPGMSTSTKDCWCNNGKFECDCLSNDCPVPCPVLPLVQGDKCSKFDVAQCNYTTQPCCLQGNEAVCVANSTCSCDEISGSVNCTTLPITFCANGTNSTKGDRGDKLISKKKLRKGMNKKTMMKSHKTRKSGP